MSNEKHGLHERGRSLEEEFFLREDQKLLERLREQRSAEEARAALAKATGISNPAVLDKLRDLAIGPETATALSIVPLVEVAWADGELDAKERDAVLGAARESGFAPGSVEHSLLEAWLKRKPAAGLLTAWAHTVEAMVATLAAPEVERLKAGLLDRARAVASASGGVLGLGSKVSKSEQAMLDKLATAFRRPA